MVVCKSKGMPGFSADVKRLAADDVFIRHGFPKMDFIDLPKPKKKDCDW